MKYWCKILKMSNSRYVRKAYNMMLNENNTNCWSNKIKEILYRFHLGEYRLSQNVGNEVSFLNTLKQRLMEASDHRWLEIVQTRERYHIYRNFKPCRYKELYLNVINFTIYRKCISRFRMGVCCINSDQLRFANIQDNVCPLCMENEEDEIHILLQCPVYQDLRIRYLYPFNEPNNQSFLRIMSNDESSYIHNLSLFRYHAFKRRNNNLITFPDTM